MEKEEFISILQANARRGEQRYEGARKAPAETYVTVSSAAFPGVNEQEFERLAEDTFGSGTAIRKENNVFEIHPFGKSAKEALKRILPNIPAIEVGKGMPQPGKSR